MTYHLIGILGLGTFGSTIALSLVNYDVDVIAIDIDESPVEAIADYVTQAIVGDFTSQILLEDAGIGDCDVVIISAGEDLEVSALAVLNCQRLAVPKIICRAKNENFAEILTEIGATIIIKPEEEAGERLALTLMRDKIEDILYLDEKTTIIEFNPPKDWVGQTLSELNLSNSHGIKLLGYRSKEQGFLQIDWRPDTIVQSDYKMVGLTTTDRLEKHEFLKS